MRDTGVDTVFLPVDGTSDDKRLLLPATVLASWFGAHLEIVAMDRGHAAAWAAVADGLGIPVDPVAVLDGTDTATWLGADDTRRSRSICVVANDSPGVALARSAPQPTFVTTESLRKRMSTGPLVVPLTGAESDADALAVAASWARALEVRLRLLVDLDQTPAPPDTTVAVRRLDELAIEHDLDRVHGGGDRPEFAVAGSRLATALVVAADRFDDVTVDRARDEGVSVLVAPPLAPEAAGGPGADRSVDIKTAASDVAVLSGEESLERLEANTIGRLGYVDDGWPTVVPVNYATAGGDIFIRSLPGTKLAVAQRNEIVCLEVDHVDPDTRSGWSVLAHGTLDVVADPQALRAAWDSDPQPFVTADRWEWLRLIPLSLTGRRVPADRVA